MSFLRAVNKYRESTGAVFLFSVDFCYLSEVCPHNNENTVRIILEWNGINLIAFFLMIFLMYFPNDFVQGFAQEMDFLRNF